MEAVWYAMATIFAAGVAVAGLGLAMIWRRQRENAELEREGADGIAAE